MKVLMCPLILCACLLVPTMGAAPVVATADRDLTAYNTALQDVSTKSADWEAAVGATDAARDAYDAALAALNTAIADEGVARQALETAQQAASDAYDAVPKEDSLAP